MLLYSASITYLTPWIEQMFNKYSEWNGFIQKFYENELLDISVFWAS